MPFRRRSQCCRAFRNCDNLSRFAALPKPPFVGRGVPPAVLATARSATIHHLFSTAAPCRAVREPRVRLRKIQALPIGAFYGCWLGVNGWPCASDRETTMPNGFMKDRLGVLWASVGCGYKEALSSMPAARLGPSTKEPEARRIIVTGGADEGTKIRPKILEPHDTQRKGRVELWRTRQRRIPIRSTVAASKKEKWQI